jgi:hypothetical protein
LARVAVALEGEVEGLIARLTVMDRHAAWHVRMKGNRPSETNTKKNRKQNKRTVYKLSITYLR